MKYGRAIRIVRTARGLSQQELAKKLRVVPSFVSLLESGDRNPSTRTLQSIAGALRIPIHLLVLLASGRRELGQLQPAEAQALATTLLHLVMEGPDASPKS